MQVVGTNDVRKNHPYAMYDKVNFEQITLTHGDSMDRYYCHIQEIYQSLNIIEQLIDNIPEGEFYIKQKPIIKVPEGQWYFAVEGASGEFGAYLDSRGGQDCISFEVPSYGSDTCWCYG